MNIEIVDIAKNSTTSAEVSEAIFNKDYNESLVHQISTAYMAGSRQGSKAQKNRSAVRGGGKKPFAQKGSGRARAGTIRSPIWRSGGVTFAASPRNYDKKVNKKMYQGAMRVIFSELLRSNRLQVVNEINIDKPNTKSVLALTKQLKVEDVLLVTELLDENLYLSARNLYHVGVTDVDGIDPVSLIGYKNIVLTQGALAKIEAWL